MSHLHVPAQTQHITKLKVNNLCQLWKITSIYIYIYIYIYMMLYHYHRQKFDFLQFSLFHKNTI